MSDDAMQEKEKEKNIHAGHRDRLRTQFREHGLEPFTDIQALEMLLFYAFPQKDTNPAAHALLERFGSFRKVMEASVDDLLGTRGIGERSALLISLVAALNRRYLKHLRNPSERRRVLKTVDDYCDYAKDLFRYRATEEIYMICMNGDRRVQSEHLLASGDVSSVGIPLRKMVEITLREDAVYVLLAHNHIADLAVPSKADVTSTAQVYRLLQTLGVMLVDHVVVADGECVSMRDSNAFNCF